MKKLSILFVFALFSCETILEEVEGLPAPEIKLVVHSFIAPQDSLIEVRVDESTPILGVYQGYGRGSFSINGTDTTFFNGTTVTDARVLISEGTKSITLPYIAKEGVYRINARNFEIVAGKTYQLSVEAKGKKINATCSVPVDQVAIKRYDLDSTQWKGNQWGKQKEISLNLEWDDIKQRSNFYYARAYTYLQQKNTFPTSTGTQTNEGIYYYNWYSNQERLLNDKNADGANFKTKGNIYLHESNNQGNSYQQKLILPKQFPIVMELLNIDENYYQFYKSLDKQRQNDGNPFVEPTPIYSNIKGGLGCFGASNKTIKRVEY